MVEQVPWAMGKSPLTTPMVVVLSTFARLLSWQEVSRVFRVSWGTVRQAVAQAVCCGFEHHGFAGFCQPRFIFELLTRIRG